MNSFREGETEISIHLLVHFPHTIIAGAGPGLSQEPGIPSRSPTWVAVSQVRGPTSAAFLGTLDTLKVEQPGLRPLF